MTELQLQEIAERISDLVRNDVRRLFDRDYHVGHYRIEKIVADVCGIPSDCGLLRRLRLETDIADEISTHHGEG